MWHKILHWCTFYLDRFRACLLFWTGAVLGFLSGGGRDIFRGWRKSPMGWRKNCALSPFSQHFLISYTPLILVYAHCFDILDTCYKEIHKIYFLNIFLVHLLVFISKFGSPQRPRFRGGGRNPLKRSGSGEGGRPAPPP